MARNYLHVPDRVDAAVSRMDQAAQLEPNLWLVKPISLPDGPTLSGLSLSNAATALQKAASAISTARLPLFGFPSYAELRQYERKYRKAPVLLQPDPSLVVGGIDELVRSLPEFSRFDRLVTWTPASGIAIYPAYATRPIGSCPDCADRPAACAWVAAPTTRPSGDELLAWTPSRLLLMDGQSGAMQWKLDIASLPPLDVMAEVQPDQPLPVGPVIGPRIGGPIIIGPGGRMILRGGVVIRGPINLPGGPAVAPLAPAPAPQVEAITKVTPVGDLAIVATSSGRLACIALENGDVLWQMRLADHAVDRVLADDDFTVIKVTNNNNVELLVLDTRSGRLLARRGFSVDSGVFPVNFALGDDGTLAYTTPDQLFIFDLYEVQTDQRLGKPRGVTPQMQETLGLFRNMDQPDQLLIHGGLVLAVCQNGAYIRGYSEQTAQLRQYHAPVNGTMALTTETTNDPQTSLAIAGEYVYARSHAAFIGYNIAHPWVSWDTPDADAPTMEQARNMFIGKDAVVLLDEPQTAGVQTQLGADASGAPSVEIAPAAGGAPSCLVRIFSRVDLPGRAFATESGVCFAHTDQTDPHGFLAWQAVDGGLYYLDGDHQLHVLRVVRELN